MSTDADLRRAVAGLTDRERAALLQQSHQAARRWSSTSPSIGQVWTAFAAVIDEIDRGERARQASAEAAKHRPYPGL